MPSTRSSTEPPARSRPTSLLVLAAAGLCFTAGAARAQTPFTVGNLVVSRVGDGTTALANTGGPVSLLEYTTTGSVVRTIAIPSGSGGLQLSGTAVSEGMLSLSQNGQALAIGGYLPPFTGTGSLASRTDADAPRGYLTIGADGSLGTPVAIGAFSGNNIRSAVVSNTGAYFAGGTTGTIYRAGTTNTTVQSTVTNTRVVKIISDKLYFSTGSGTSRGVWTFDTSLPTAAATASVFVNQGGSAAPYDFAINPANTVAYLTNGTVLERWTNDGSGWSLGQTSGTIGSGLTGLAVLFGATDSIYTVDPSTLFGLSFGGGSFTTATTLAAAGTNYAFRGLSVAPVPEPAAPVLLGGAVLLAAGIGIWRRPRAGRVLPNG